MQLELTSPSGNDDFYVGARHENPSYSMGASWRIFMHICQDQTMQGAFLGLREMLNVFGGNRH